MTGNIWIDLQLSSAEIEAEMPDISDELPRIPTVGNAMGQRGLKEAIDDPVPKTTQTARLASGRSRNCQRCAHYPGSAGQDHARP